MISKIKNKKGFTLVELLVVIAVIGILAVVAIPALFKNIGKAKVADATADYNAIRSAVLTVYAEDNDLVYESLKYEGKLTSYLEKTLDTTPFGGQYYIVPTNFKNEHTDKYETYSFPAYEINKDGSIGKKNHGTGNMFEITLAIRPEGWNNKEPYGMPKITKDQLLKLANDIGHDRVFLGSSEILKEGNEIFIGLIPKK